MPNVSRQIYRRYWPALHTIPLQNAMADSGVSRTQEAVEIFRSGHQAIEIVTDRWLCYLYDSMSHSSPALPGIGKVNRYDISKVTIALGVPVCST
ncbi:hypothetical protein J1614_010352 [Plenodomus biglobosus]|nr:hypothetical protein J1614_010352 [Plenodomus biglobosus]